MTQVCSARAILARHNHNNHGVITFSKTYSNLSCPVKCSLRPVAFSTWLNFCCQKKPASWVWSKQVEWCPTFNWHQSDWCRSDGTYGDSCDLFLPNFWEKYCFFFGFIFLLNCALQLFSSFSMTLIPLK